jgi:hypothetical protein
MGESNAMTLHCRETAPPPALRRRRLLALAAAVALAPAARAATIADQQFDDRITVAGRELVLNGVGVRAVAWLTAYAAGLYLGVRVADGPGALAQPGPKRLRMRMLVDVDAQELVKAIEKGTRRNLTPAARAALAPRIAAVSRNVGALGGIRKGDTLDLDLVPARGTVVTRNGAEQGSPVPGDDLYAAVLAIFVGEVPVDPALKAGLLGAR